MNIISVLYSKLSNTYIINNITYEIYDNYRESLRQFFDNYEDNIRINRWLS